MGAHAGEGVAVIFDRKIADIELIGKTFWLMRSPKARPIQVQDICKPSPVYAIFVEPSSKGGARPTTNNKAAKEYSVDKKIQSQLPKGVGPVTGKIDSSATALVFDMMTTNISGTIIGLNDCKKISSKEHFIFSQVISKMIEMSPFHLDHLLYQWGRYKKYDQ